MVIDSFGLYRRSVPQTKPTGDGSASLPHADGDVNRLDRQEHQGVVTRTKAKQVKSHKDQIEQEKFQGLNDDVQDFMGQYAKLFHCDVNRENNEAKDLLHGPFTSARPKKMKDND
ncbi:hypothetical protein M9H77_17797 [Catharanthus roseus]|uniref:Uncharacterized protein n=1 Tax=Catharanthus roseus TaxID=4058 RepID=A0ACC0B5P1_CATRO|nr:hypothetical protein M9H77_17797 [Catharanthus roseus]